MVEYRYAKGRVAESIQFITQELKEFEEDYASKGWQIIRMTGSFKN